ncbi:MAG: T9SS type A sorting domain-containing protein [Sphingobacteriaceae bacterium]|nr:T9SS type A sorting domain-containing protein [Sphingobacteriaceae bacterium]
MKEQNLYAYIKETNSSVAANFTEENNIVSINVDAPPAGKTLVIDPPLYWSTYWGSSGGEQTMALICSGTGEYVYIAGYTNSTNYPTTNPGAGTYYQGTFAGGTDAFVAQFDTMGVHYWSTYYGGSLNEGATSYTGISIAVGQGNTLWMVGTTNSTDLPVQNGGGGAYYQGTLAGGYDIFVAKFNLAGVRSHATYIGGSLDDGGLSHGNGADCDASGNLFIASRMMSTNFPLVNPGGSTYFDNTQNGSDDIVLIELSPAGAMLWSTIYGGSGDDINYSMDLHVDRINSKVYLGTCSASTNMPTLNPGGSFYFDNTQNGATDMYLGRFSLGGTLEWGTYIGGSGDEWLAMSVSTAPDGDVAMITLTGSTNMPLVTPGGTAFFDNTHNGGSWDIYVCRFEQTGVMSWGTYYGTANNEHCQHNLTFDGAGNIIICGVSDGTASPPTFNPGGAHFYDGTKDAQGTYCLVQFDPTATMLWGTYWGGSGHDHILGAVGACIGVSAHSDIFITGETNSTDLPMLNPGFGAFYKPTNSGGQEGFVAKFNNDIINTILPIELQAFGCEPSIEGINIYWSTATEKNNEYFTLEKTQDGNNFEELATIKGAGNSASTKNYFYLDKSPQRGVNYYRLVQTDKNGNVNYFKLINCQSTEANEEVVINVYTITGQFLYSQKTGNFRSDLDKSELARGIYLVEVVGTTETRSIKYVKAN